MRDLLQLNLLFNLSRRVCDADLESPDAVVSFVALTVDKDNHVFRRDAETPTRAGIGGTDPTGKN
jgi:hypothetical protein